MADITHHLYKTQLKDRELYYDGESVVSPEHVLSAISLGLTEGLRVTHLTDEIQQFNALVPAKKRITEKTQCGPLSFDWNLPDEYKTLNVVEYIIDRWAEECSDDDCSSDLADVRAKRVADELAMYKRLNLIPVLRAIIYIINTLRKKDIVWGVGRGSSVSSYVLYLIGAHDVDSIKYGLDFSEFLREPTSSNKEK